MSFVKELQRKQEAAFKKNVAEYAEQLKPMLQESAEQGFKGWQTRIDNRTPEEGTMFFDDKFIDELSNHLKGFKIEIEKKWFEPVIKLSTTKGYHRYYLKINWK